MKVKDTIIEIDVNQEEFQKTESQLSCRLPVGHRVFKGMTVAVVCKQLKLTKKFRIRKVKILENHIVLALKHDTL